MRPFYHVVLTVHKKSFFLSGSHVKCISKDVKISFLIVKPENNVDLNSWDDRREPREPPHTTCCTTLPRKQQGSWKLTYVITRLTWLFIKWLCMWRALTSWKGDWSFAKKKKSVGHDEDSAAFPWRFNRNCVRTQVQISENMHVRTGTAVIAVHPSNKTWFNLGLCGGNWMGKIKKNGHKRQRRQVDKRGGCRWGQCGQVDVHIGHVAVRLHNLFPLEVQQHSSFNNSSHREENCTICENL